MAKIILRRLLQLIPTLFVVVAFTFIATRLIPGDPVAAMVGDQYDVSKVEEMRASLGLDDPIIVQFWNYLVSICQGDFGTSYYFNQPAIDMIAQRLPSAVKFVDGLADICEQYQCTRVQLAVAFLRAQGDFVNVICGAHKPEQIEADAPAADVELSSETVADIRKRLAALDAEFE